MSNATLSSLAILKVNWDQSRADFIDILVPFVAEALRRSQAKAVSAPDIRNVLEKDFGLDIPLNCLRTVLNRAAKHGYVRQAQGVYWPIDEMLAKLEFAEAERRALEVHTTLLDNLVTFVYERFGERLSQDYAERLLLNYLKEFDVDILSKALRGTPLPDRSAAVQRDLHLVTAFVRHISEADAQAFAGLETVVKGYMLANVVFFPDPANVARRITSTVVFLDTPFLMNVLGYNGKTAAEPCREMLDLLYELGGEAACFEHTLAETESILLSCAELVENGAQRDVHGPMRGTFDYFVRSGGTGSDVRLAVASLEQNLAGKRVKVKSKPPYIPAHVVDEKELEATLDTRVTYSRDGQARQRDVDSLSAVHRLRKGRHPIHLEDSGALFVTPNIDLVYASDVFFGRISPQGTAPVALTNVALTNLLWLKKPLRAPELPRKLIIAQAFAAMRPSDALWQRYLAEIEKLQSQGSFTAEQYLMLRYSLQAEDLLMEVTKGQEAAFTEGTIAEVLEKARDTLASQIKAVYEDRERVRQAAEGALQSRLAETQRQLKESLARDDIRQLRFERLGQWLARIVVLSGGFLVVVVLGIGALLSIWGLPSFAKGWFRYMLAMLQVVFVLAGVVSFVRDGWLQELSRTVEVRLARWVTARLERMFG